MSRAYGNVINETRYRMHFLAGYFADHTLCGRPVSTSDYTNCRANSTWLKRPCLRCKKLLEKRR